METNSLGNGLAGLDPETAGLRFNRLLSAWLSAKLLSKEEPPIAVGEPITKGSIVTR
jgi:hypothetical protein